MPTQSVGAPGDVSVTIPSTLTERFREEVVSDLANAATNVEEGATWLRDCRDDRRLHQEDLPRFADALAAFEAAQRPEAEGIVLTGSPERLAALLRSAATAAADDLRAELDTTWAPRTVRALLAEIGALSDLFVRHALDTAPRPGGGR